ncbi:MAG: glycosyltransferase, partial [Rubrobacteraceae bacterium]
MKILIGSDTYYPDVNGASYFARRLAKGLAERGHEVHALRPSGSFSPEVTEREGTIIHGIPSVPVPFHAPFRFSPPPFSYRSVLREVESIEPEVVHVQSHFSIGRTLVRLSRDFDLPIVATNHFMPDNLIHYLHLPERAERAVMDLAWRDFARVFSQVELVTAPTPFAARLAEEKGAGSDVTPVSCGIDTMRFNPGNDGSGFRRGHGIPDRPTFLYVGRLDAEKRVEDGIRALKLVREEVDAQFMVAGDGRRREELAALARSEGVSEHVIFTGFVEDEELPDAYAACDVFCNAGVAELQSIVTMEAMATGKPVVAANARALPHLVHEGVNGHRFEPGDVQTLASRLAELLSDEGKRAEMGER